jgi:Ca2+:H+ antiporter
MTGDGVTHSFVSSTRFMVTLGWIVGKPLTLLFDPYESIVLFLAGTYLLHCLGDRIRLTWLHERVVLIVNYTVADGKSNWLEGMILMCLYLMLAVTFWYYPGTWFPAW